MILDMLEWLRRADSGRVFLDDGRHTLTYAEAAQCVAEVEVTNEPLRPRLTIEGILEILATAISTTAVVLGPEVAAPKIDHRPGSDFVLLTSGTSGSPKPISQTWANWAAASKASMAHLGHGPEDTWLLAMPLHHVAGLGILMRSAFAGGTVRVMEKFEPESFASALREVTMASAVPTMLLRVLEADSGPYRGLRAVLVGGGPIPNGLLEAAQQAGIPALPTYGMTETCGQVATLKPGSAPEEKANALPGVHLRIGSQGRIEIQGPMVSADVVDDHGWFTTGDLGYIDDEAALVVTGRADDLIVTGGENVSPQMVNTVLSSLDGVDESVVVGLASPVWGTEIAVIYTGTANPESLRSAELPGFAKPKRIRQVDRIPKTPLGKPDLSAIRDLFSG